MDNKINYHHKFHLLKCCVLIPTYNNGSTLERVINGILQYTDNIIIINDGSTDHSSSLLASYEEIRTIDLPRNKGKGNALKIGFKTAAAEGFDYAISIDSDGQHYPDDLPVFLDALEQRGEDEREILVVGSRKMDDPSVPDKSFIGNRFSSFWFWVETGIRLQDTQCGYRLYPLNLMNSLHLYTRRFELEIEVLVKAAWAGAEIVNLPVKVLYDPKERVTHFRPFQDVLRIALLNICFVGIAVFYIAPRNLLRKFSNRKKDHRKAGTELLESEG